MVCGWQVSDWGGPGRRGQLHMVCGWQVPVWIRCAYDAGDTRHTHGAHIHMQDMSVSRGEGGLGMKTAASYHF